MRLPSYLAEIIKLNPLRKNARNVQYFVYEFNEDDTYKKASAYETFQEALYHVCLNGEGDICARESGRKRRLVAFFCKYDNRMKFGFGACEYEKSSWSSKYFWVNFK